MKETISGCSIFSGLTAAYISSQSPNEVTALFGGMFNSNERFINRMSALKSISYPRQALADVLLAYNQEHGSGPAALANIELLRREETQVVITGQQAGIFTGPLYTVYKAITAIKLARKLSQDHDVPVIPLFWVASEDHDYDEIAKIAYLSGEKLKEVQLKQEHHGKLSIAHVKIGEHLSQLTELIMDEIEIPQSDAATAFSSGSDSTLRASRMDTIFKQTQIQGESLADWFSRIMAHLFANHGLVLIDPMTPGVRALQGEAFKTAFERRAAIREALEQATESVKAMGYEPGIRPVEGNTQIFHYFDGERLPLKEDSDGFYVESKGIKRVLSFETIMDLIEKTPQAFSTNVVLRPVFQDRLMPVIAYIGGPGEIAYYGQLGGVFGAMDMEMPVVYPRESFTLVPQATTDSLASIGMSMDEMEDILCGGLIRKKEAFLKEADNVHIDEVLNTFIEKFDQDYGDVLAKICGIHDELRDMADKNNGIIHSQFEYLRDKAHRFHRQNNKALLKKLDRVGNVLKPGEKLQERELNILSFYAEWGDGLIETLLNELPLSHYHRMVELD